MKVEKVAFTMYPVKDVPRAREFYEKKLGLEPGLQGNQGDSWWVEYDLPKGGCFAITNFGADAPSASAGGTVSFEVDDLSAWITDLKSKKVEFTSDVINGPKCRMIVCLDPEGNSIILHQMNRG